MQLAPHHLEKLRDDIRSNPLKEAEMRRVEGLGEQYIALSSHKPSDEYARVYTLRIDKVEYSIYAKVGAEKTEGESS